MHISLRWLIPPLLGLAGFVVSRGMPAGRPEAARGEKRRSTHEARPNSAADLQRDLQKLREQAELASGQVAEADASLSTAALRGRIQELLKRLASFDDETEWLKVEKTEASLCVALFELGKREGMAAVEWVDECAPERRGHVMAGWAQADPDAALDAVIASKRKPPCFPGTVMELLQHRAKAGPEALRSAWSEIPWVLLFAGKTNSYQDELLFQPDMDVKPWLESGAAEALAKDGIPLSGFFSAWASTDPIGALARLDTWDDVRVPFSDRVSEFLGAGWNKEDLRADIQRGLEALPEDRLARIAGGLAEFGKGNPGRRNDLLNLYPILRHPTSESGE
ncbi:hypothetical protein [Luteolibacter luteus]|uniref:Uncharacterized protein n=1 Tax=Luteolibacter luteus TaxID=2728835 RepID=A0A858RDB6_9BACT|nr:hypothetical protein [Luteolibacter luteus]QJE94389.1 hypothetical protein HHL09_00840 [Luteolibacter luteus]